MRWRNFKGDEIKHPIKTAVETAIRGEISKGRRLSVCIGTDSQVKGGITEFATVIVFRRAGQGGFMFIHQDKTNIPMSIKERMLMVNHGYMNSRIEMGRESPTSRCNDIALANLWDHVEG